MTSDLQLLTWTLDQPCLALLMLPLVMLSVRSNEIYKQIKVDAKVREWEHEQRCIAENTAMWDKQERARQEQIDKLKVWQAKQEAEAKARPEAKQWIDPAIIDR